MKESSQRFEGWHQPSEKAQLSTEQIDKLGSLEKVSVTNNHAESFVGKFSRFRSSTTPEPQQMIRTGVLRNFVRETAAANHVSPWDVTQQIRSLGVEKASDLLEIEKRYKERIVYVSDVHEGSEDLYKKLEEVAQTRPEQVLFVGDVIGTSEFGTLQKTFYDFLNNHTRNELRLHENPELTDEAILTYAGKNPPEADFTVKKDFLKVREAELKLAKESDESIKKKLEGMTDAELATEVRKYAGYEHYGHYVSNLPDETKTVLAAGLKKNAERLLGVIKKMQESGTKVAIVEGNWDASAPIDFVPGEPKPVPIANEKRLFNPKTFFESHHVPFYDKMGAIETDTTLQVVLPFNAQKNYDAVSAEDKKKVMEAVTKARADEKSVIILGHGQPDWQIHKLPTPNAQPQGENAQIVAGFTAALAEIRPDEIVYGHLHNPLTDEQGVVKDKNVKYALTVKGNEVSVVQNPSEFNDQSIVASYLPLREIGEIFVSRVDSQQKVKGFGGNREPVRIK